MKQNQTFFYGTNSNLTSYLFSSKNIKVFQWLSKSKYSSFKTKMNPNTSTYSNLTLFFIGHKIIKCFNDFYNWHLSISLQKWTKQLKWNKIKWYVCNSDSTFPYLQNSTLFKWLLKWMNDNNFEGKMSFVLFHSINVKGTWAHLPKKNSWPGAKITVIFRLSMKIF